jgi:DNA-directed RNA polymerase specialized sigma24 family protein
MRSNRSPLGGVSTGATMDERADAAAARERAVEEPDPVTIRAAVAGDLAAFEDLVRAYQVPVWRFLRHLLGDPELAEDVAQEAFLRLFQRLPSYRFESRLSTWVLQVARNAGIDAIRARDRRARHLRRLGPAATAAPGEPGLGHELTSALATLSPKRREVLLLIEVLGFSHREVAEVLGIPVGTVKSRAFEARRDVTRWFGADEAEPGEATS